MYERLYPEQYDSLPDIPDPAEHAALVGHEIIAGEMAADYRAGRLHHGLLLAGPRGVGKATLAFRLAAHLLANPVAGNAPERLTPPDMTSSLGRMIASGSHPSILHISRPFDDKRKVFRQGITVDEIRRIARFLSMSSHDDSWRIVIVDPADDMNRQAANALLKNLEEPPRKTLFMLVAHQAGRLLPTLRSRCRMVRFEGLPGGELAAVLAAVGDGTDMPAAAMLDRAGGSAREALLLTRYGGMEIAEAIEQVAGANRFDAIGAQRLADAVTGRDRAVQFAIFNDQFLHLVARAAERAVLEGRKRSASDLSGFWQEAVSRTTTAEAYNLDRREHVMNLLYDLRRAMAAAEA